MHGYHVLKPWETPGPIGVGIEWVGRLLWVQVKSSSYRRGTGYYCEFKPQNERKGALLLPGKDVSLVRVESDWSEEDEPEMKDRCLASCEIDNWCFRQLESTLPTPQPKISRRIHEPSIHTPTACGLVASNSRSTYCRIPPLA